MCAKLHVYPVPEWPVPAFLPGTGELEGVGRRIHPAEEWEGLVVGFSVVPDSAANTAQHQPDLLLC